MRIVAASDLHGAYGEVAIPVADLLILAGDSTFSGTLADIAQLGSWLREQPVRRALVISGNHDIAMQTDQAQARRLLAPAIYLCDESVAIDGLRFYGSPWIRPHHGAFNLEPAELLAKWSAIPATTDVLVTHMPPYGVRDIGSGGEPLGDSGLRDRVTALPGLCAHVFGHVHEGHGRARLGRTLFANVAICDRDARPVRPVTVIDLAREPGGDAFARTSV